MNIFTFAENRTRLVRAPLYAVMGLISLLFPRDPDLWVFGRRNGVGEGPLAVLTAAGTLEPHLRRVWIAQGADQQREAQALGLESYRSNSLRAWWLTLRAGVLVLAYGLGDVVRPCAPGAHIVQTWHGAPLKRIRLDSPVSLGQTPFGKIGAWAFAGLFKAAGRIIGTVPTSSTLVAERFQSAWGWPDRKRIAVLGDPRCDVLLRADAATVRDAARRALARHWNVTELPEHLVLYAPTWRDGGTGPTFHLRDLTEEARKQLSDADCWLVLRAHPWGSAAGRLDAGADVPVRFASPVELGDINQVLAAFDVLITDFSAISIDYSLLVRPQIFYAPDLATYISSRGLYEDYEVFTGGRFHDTWADVLTELHQVLTDPEERRRNVEQTSAQILERYHEFRDGKAAERLVRHVRARTARAISR